MSFREVLVYQGQEFFADVCVGALAVWWVEPSYCTFPLLLLCPCFLIVVLLVVGEVDLVAGFVQGFFILGLGAFEDFLVAGDIG